jgi:hypothetical protein
LEHQETTIRHRVKLPGRVGEALMIKYSYDVNGNMVVRTIENVSPPEITAPPVKQVATPGDIVSFSVVVADARAVTFQWKFKGADIAGATGDSLLLPNVSADDAGQYSVVVINPAGSVTSDPAALLLRANPIVNTATPPRLTVYSDEGGSVIVTPMKPTYNLGETVTLTATPLLDNVFAGWVGDLNSSNPVTLTMNGNRTVRAQFAAAPSALLQVIGYSDAEGSVTVTPMKPRYALGETVTLTAAPVPPRVFAGWVGDLNSSSNPVAVTMNGNKTVRAQFAVVVPIPAGVITLWRGETDASDLIGGHHGSFFAGTVATAPSVTAAGKVGGAFDFDGTVYVRVPDAPTLRPAQLTAEAWVFPIANAVGAYDHTVITRGGLLNTWNLCVTYNRKPKFWSFGMQAIEGPAAIPLNEWTHLAISFDGTTKRLYVNGVEMASIGGLGAIVYDTAEVPVTIGADPNGTSPFHGQIDEVALYNRALTEDEIADIHYADFLGKNFAQPYFTSPSQSQLPDGALGANYTQTLTTLLGTSPVSFSLGEGELPPGLTLSAAGLISGVPGASGTFGFTVLATDAAGAFSEKRCGLLIFASVPIPAGVIALWRGETDASDLIGGHHGSFFAGPNATTPTVTAAGKVGGAFDFDGTVYVHVPDAPTLRPAQLTAEAWVFSVGTGDNVQMVIARVDIWNLWLNYNRKPRFGMRGTQAIEGPAAIPLNEWTHLAISFDGTTKRLYVNGAEVASIGGLGAIVYDTAEVPVTIGAGPVGTSPFHGQIDEVALYNRALSGADIASIFQAGPAGKHL